MNMVFMWSPTRTNELQLLVIHSIHRFVIVGEANAITQSSDASAAALVSIEM